MDYPLLGQHESSRIHHAMPQVLEASRGLWKQGEAHSSCRPFHGKELHQDPGVVVPVFYRGDTGIDLPLALESLDEHLCGAASPASFHRIFFATLFSHLSHHRVSLLRVFSCAKTRL